MLALPALSPIQKRISLLTLTFFAVLYFTSSAGLNCSNDGSHFALAKSIYYNHSTEIKPYFNYVKCCDFAEKDGKIYSDRLPGNAFLMLPFLAYSNLLQLIMPDNSGTDYEADVVFISLLPNLCGIIGLTFLFLLFRKTGFSFNLSIISTIIYGIATLQWYESAHAFSHAPSSMFVAMAVYFTILVKDVRADQKFIYFSAALIGLSTLVELQNILFLGPIFLYVFILINPSGFLEFNKWVPVMLGSVAVAVFFVGCLVLYNYITFGEFLLKSNTYNPMFPEEKTFKTAMDGNFLLGLDKLFTSFSNIKVYYIWSLGIDNNIPGLFVVTPVLLLSPLGFIIFFKKQRNMAILFSLMISISVVIAALHKTTLTRHIFTINFLLYFPVTYILQAVWNFPKIRIAGVSFIAALIILSIAHVAYTLNTSWGHYGHGIFMFKHQIPVFFAFYLPLITILFLWTRKSLSRSW